jgi:hypothetical protein
MEIRDLPNWESFLTEVESLRQRYARSPYRLLFRGQTDSRFRLTTTLERSGCEGMSFADYCLLVHKALPAVETFTGVKWDVPDYSVALEQSFRDVELFATIPYRFPDVELYRCLVYLRHHGFPSPLLDWTRSPYVAAFFAFRDFDRGGDYEGPPQRSIYVYCEYPVGTKGGAVGAPCMRAIGPYVRSHPRHFRQQSDYTICGAFDTSSGWRFHPHEQVAGSRGERQDALWKLNLPSSEGRRVLRLFDEYNLNAFSLFDTEETLLETMWFREFVSGLPTPTINLDPE